MRKAKKQRNRFYAAVRRVDAALTSRTADVFQTMYYWRLYNQVVKSIIVEAAAASLVGLSIGFVTMLLVLLWIDRIA
ncbi:MAG: hypothetical protein AAB427_13400 [Chloroflexota bacterium]